MARKTSRPGNRAVRDFQTYGNTENFRGMPAPGPDQDAIRLRALALELAIKAGPLTLGREPTIKGAELTAQAELIEAWLKEAKP